MMETSVDAYLDIETTGLSPLYADITVIEIYLVNGNESRLVQLVGEKVSADSLLQSLDGVDTIYTYNGSRFDLPFIRACLGIELTQHYIHHALMYDCWRNNLRGGFKAVEVQLGIPRELKGVGGFEAVILWYRYRDYGDQNALDLLLQYNREDVVNLKTLREMLGVNYQGASTCHQWFNKKPIK